MNRNKKIYSSIIIAFLYVTSFTYAASDPVLVINAANTATLPKHFRISNTTISSTHKPSTLGLANLHIAGGAQFSEKQFLQIKKTLPNLGYDVDLRQESHGFANGLAISWYTTLDQINLGKTDQQVRDVEKELLESLLLMPQPVTIYQHIKINGKTQFIFYQHLHVDSTYSEKELIQKNGINYQRFYVTDRLAPVNKQVDRFIAYEKSLPHGSWIYFHCAAGRGRTTTFMAMFDMMHNANRVSFNDIMQREYLIGGVALWQTPTLSKQKRYEFLKQFYQYCQQNMPLFKIPWSSWIANVKMY